MKVSSSLFINVSVVVQTGVRVCQPLLAEVVYFTNEIWKEQTSLYITNVKQVKHAHFVYSYNTMVDTSLDYKSDGKISRWNRSLSVLVSPL